MSKLKLKKPYIDDPAEAFVSAKYLCKTLGPGETLNLYMDNESEIVKLDSYKRIAERHNISLKLMFEFRKFERYLFDIDFPCWLLFSNEKTIKLLINRGYDGAIFANANGKLDFKIFQDRV